MLLYKYGNPERIDVLLNGLVRFTQPADFNDPFEVAPHLAALLPSGNEDSYLAQFESQAQEHFESAIKRRLADLSLPSGVSAAVSDVILSQFGGADVISYVKAMLPHLVKAMKPTFGTYVQQSVGDRFGILSLSETSTNLLMWAHYADCHRGMVFEFDSQDEMFHRESAEGAVGRVLKVVYTPARPALTMVDPTIALEEHVDRLIRGFLLTKAVDWQYEREWRLIHPLDKPEEYPHHISGRIHLFPIPRRALIGVILGARASDATSAAVRAALADVPELAHVSLSQSRVSSTQFEVTVEPVNRF